jgi:hypothetical protein
MNSKKCNQSDHQYDVKKYDRDDQAFYLTCINCGEIQCFFVDTEEELYDLFGLNDED